jgi:two-component system CheB/CheR fusion protein
MANSNEMPEQAANGRSEPVIVAIGASAGGVRALQDFFSVMPSDTGAAFVVIIHLDPDRRSELANVIASRTAMPVVQVQQREKIHANHVYVIPPDRRLEMVDHEVSAVAFEEAHGKRSPIDQFFRSVAEKLGDGFAVILSGAGSDGVPNTRQCRARQSRPG